MVVQAVVAAALLSEGVPSECSLIDVSDQLQGLKRLSALHSWRVRARGTWYHRHEDVPSEVAESHKLLPSMFAPTEEAAASLKLDRAMRVLPHMQDTGGFFIAVIERREASAAPAPSAAPSAEPAAEPAAEAVAKPMATPIPTVLTQPMCIAETEAPDAAETEAPDAAAEKAEPESGTATETTQMSDSVHYHASSEPTIAPQVEGPVCCYTPPTHSPLKSVEAGKQCEPSSPLPLGSPLPPATPAVMQALATLRAAGHGKAATTAKQLHQALANEDGFGQVRLPTVKKACSKLAKREAAEAAQVATRSAQIDVSIAVDKENNETAADLSWSEAANMIWSRW